MYYLSNTANMVTGQRRLKYFMYCEFAHALSRLGKAVLECFVEPTPAPTGVQASQGEVSGFQGGRNMAALYVRGPLKELMKTTRNHCGGVAFTLDKGQPQQTTFH